MGDDISCHSAIYYEDYTNLILDKEDFVLIGLKWWKRKFALNLHEELIWFIRIHLVFFVVDILIILILSLLILLNGLFIKNEKESSHIILNYKALT